MLSPESVHTSSSSATAGTHSDNHSSAVGSLLEWCAHNDIFLDYRLQVVSDASNNSISVWATAHVPPGTTVAYINKDAVLSIKSCSFSNLIHPIPWGLGAQLTLAFALYGEILRGTASRWSGYLASLPSDVELPWSWALARNERVDSRTAADRGAAMQCISRTEAHRLLERSSGHVNGVLGELDQFYQSTVAPTILSNPDRFQGSTPTLRGFYRAYSLVSSRAFLVDAYHGLSMVPIADAFNHASGNNVHLESDYTVCPHCGSLQECVHDRAADGGDTVSFTSQGQPRQAHAIRTSRLDADALHGNTKAQILTNITSLKNKVHGRDAENSNSTTPTPVEVDTDYYYEMVSSDSNTIFPNTEVFNTYGETLTNAQLLVQYGFVLENNPNDRVLWEVGDIRNFCCELYNGDDCIKYDSNYRTKTTYWSGGLSNRDARSQQIAAFDSILAVWGRLLQSEDSHSVFYVLKYSDLVYYYAPKAESEGVAGIGHAQAVQTLPAVHSNGPLLCVNSNGKISYQLWLLLVLLVLQARGLFPSEMANSAESSEGRHDVLHNSDSASQVTRLFADVLGKVKELVVQQLYLEALSRDGMEKDESEDGGEVRDDWEDDIMGQSGSGVGENMILDWDESKGRDKKTTAYIPLVDYDSDSEEDELLDDVRNGTSSSLLLPIAAESGSVNNMYSVGGSVSESPGSQDEQIGQEQPEGLLSSAILAQLGAMVMRLCCHRKTGILQGATDGDIDQLLDGLDQHMWRTKMVLSLVKTELSLLDICGRSWNDFALSVKNNSKR